MHEISFAKKKKKTAGIAERSDSDESGQDAETHKVLRVIMKAEKSEE